MDQKHIIPCTIRQVLNAGVAEPVTIDGKVVYTVKLVGCVKSKEETSTNICYEVEDGSGLIEVKEWVSEKDSAIVEQKRSEINDGVYVRVVGQIRVHNGKQTIMAFHISRLADVNEITYHYLESIYIHEQHTNPACAAGVMGGLGVGVKQQGMALTVNSGETTGLDQQTSKLLEYIKTAGEDSDLGASIRDYINGNGLNEQTVLKLAQNLAEEGLIYSTVDDETFKYAL